MPLDPSEITFEPYAPGRAYGKFVCGEDMIDRWFREKAAIHHQDRCRVVVAHAPQFDYPIGFYALAFAVHGLNRKALPAFFGQDHFAALNLEWLAVHRGLQGNGLGMILMGRVLSDFAAINDIAHVPALTLKPISEAVVPFYKRIGFVSFQPKVRGGGLLLPASDLAPAGVEPLDHIE
nr:GNAT family N-acetyltransferase [Caulobacter hibisci]